METKRIIKEPYAENTIKFIITDDEEFMNAYNKALF